MPKVESVSSPTALCSGAQKLGQPVPLSNLVVDENTGKAQPAQAKAPLRWSSRSTRRLNQATNCGGALVLVGLWRSNSSRGFQRRSGEGTKAGAGYERS